MPAEDTFRDFRQPFLVRGLCPPHQMLARRERGEVRQKGWSIQFMFGADDVGEYMDYYASHRMADDSHARVRPGQPEEALPAIISGYFTSDDPDEARRQTAEYFSENRTITEMLRRKGF